MQAKRITDPATEPVTTAEAKTFARIDLDDDDTLVGTLITTAREWAEQYTGRSFITQTWRKYLDDLPKTMAGNFSLHGNVAVNLQHPPIAAITSVKTYDESDNATTISSDTYYLDLNSDPGRLVFTSIPTSGSREANAYEIIYTAGYGDAASDVPGSIKTAIKQIVAHLYEHRGDAPEQVFSAKNLLKPYRVLRL